MSIGVTDGLAENELRMRLSMESKMYGSQKMTVECTSAWKMKHKMYGFPKEIEGLM